MIFDYIIHGFKFGGANGENGSVCNRFYDAYKSVCGICIIGPGPGKNGLFWTKFTANISMLTILKSVIPAKYDVGYAIFNSLQMKALLTSDFP